ncbi:aminopeptidase M1-B-like [Curcuma longa]|uniref:aminopeptidase M1-B-like n=1 Tax=Curcuma longa TaxID=136217 RepID=UPI003D9DD0B8
MEIGQLQQNVEQFKGQPRLPKFAIPRSYNLSISVDFSNFTFLGVIEITIDIVSPTKYLVLNVADLVIEQSSIWFSSDILGGNGEELKHPSSIIEVEDDEILILGFDGLLPIGKGILSIQYSGIINDGSSGFYRSTYEQNGETQTMALTQFQPTDARRCFPCWDEPAFKATFKIALEVPSNLVALSNMPVINEKDNGIVKTIYFQESPIMSTYLVAFVVGSLDYIETYSFDGLKIRVYARVGKSNQGKFALDLTTKTLDLLKGYFSIPYGLPKLDMVVVPNFEMQGMENYGLIIFDEEYLLCDELSSSAKKQQVAEILTHELAHQWFGNLVTMEWWTDLWLNEGFANWMSCLVTDDFFPEWEKWSQFLYDTTEILHSDALLDSHPVQVLNITSGIEVLAMFDSITYKKGSMVIRMLQNYLGDKSFQKSLATYIKRYSYLNAKTEDLWNVIQEETNEPVGDIMSSWTKQEGYPIINVMLTGNILEINQSRFLLDGSFDDSQWIIPITLSHGSYDTTKFFLLNSKSTKLNLIDQDNQGNSQNGWIKLNVNQGGLYKVHYDNELGTRLRNAIEANQLSAMDKYGVLEDYFLFCKATKETLSSFLSLLNAYREEANQLILKRICIIGLSLVNLIADAKPELSNDIKLLFINLLQSPAEKLGWDVRKNELDVGLRSEIFVTLVLLGHEKTINDAIERLPPFLSNRSTIVLSPDIKKVVYISIMQTVSIANRSGYEFLLKLYRETDDIGEKILILSCFTTCPDPNILLESLNFLLSSEVLPQHVLHGLYSVNQASRDIAWRWLKFGTSEKATEISNFFASRNNPSISKTLQQKLNEVMRKERWTQSVKNEFTLGDTLNDLVRK